MFGLFGKKEAKTPEERLTDLQRKKDWAGLARVYYEMGASAMDGGDLNHAQLWLHRADTIYSADDATCDKVGEKLIDDCFERIGTLEEAELLYNTVPAEIEAKAGELSDVQVRIWGMLSMARLVKLGERLAELPGCEVLGELGWAVDMMFQSTQEAPSQEEYQRLMDVCNRLYELGDTPAFYAGGQIDAPGGAPFQVFDLSGMSVLLELNGYLDNHLRLLAALSQGAEELPAAESGVVACALLPDYYVRTGAARLEEAPRIKAELERIWSDFAAVRDHLPLEEIGRRLEEYKKLDILA
ncbi:MAG: hypothetical protein HFF44_04710 [Lawsonibacter sp.]|nr:hypothetical protein [Lawsonibacter sp.]